MFKRGETVIVSSEILFEFGKNDITKQMQKGRVLKREKVENDGFDDFTKYLIEFVNGERLWIYDYDTGSGPSLVKDPHGAFKLIRVNQGWKSGRAQCICGTEFDVAMVVEKRGKSQTEHTYVKSAICPQSLGFLSNVK